MRYAFVARSAGTYLYAHVIIINRKYLQVRCSGKMSFRPSAHNPTIRVFTVSNYRCYYICTANVFYGTFHYVYDRMYSIGCKSGTAVYTLQVTTGTFAYVKLILKRLGDNNDGIQVVYGEANYFEIRSVYKIHLFKSEMLCLSYIVYYIYLRVSSVEIYLVKFILIKRLRLLSYLDKTHMNYL